MSVSEHDYETPVAYESPAEIHRNPAPAALNASPCAGHKHSTTLGATVCPACGRFIPDAEVVAELHAPGQQHVEWMTVSKNGVPYPALDGDHALRMAQRFGNRRFCRTVITTAWAEVRTHANGEPR